MLTVGMLLVSLGTTIDFAELRRQWKVAAVSVISVTMAVIFIIYLGPFFMDGALAIAGSPIFAGGNAAMLIILDAVQEKGIETVGTFCLVLLVTQKFFGIPIASLMLRHLAKNLRDDVDFVKRYASEGEENKVKKPLRLPSLCDLFFFEPDNPAGSALRPSAACSYGLIGYIGAFYGGACDK